MLTAACWKCVAYRQSQWWIYYSLRPSVDFPSYHVPHSQKISNRHRMSALHFSTSAPAASLSHLFRSHRCRPSLRWHTLLVSLVYPSRSGFRPFTRSSLTPIFNRISNLRSYPSNQRCFAAIACPRTGDFNVLPHWPLL